MQHQHIWNTVLSEQTAPAPLRARTHATKSAVLAKDMDATECLGRLQGALEGSLDTRAHPVFIQVATALIQFAARWRDVYGGDPWSHWHLVVADDQRRIACRPLGEITIHQSWTNPIALRTAVGAELWTVLQNNAPEVFEVVDQCISLPLVEADNPGDSAKAMNFLLVRSKTIRMVLGVCPRLTPEKIVDLVHLKGEGFVHGHTVFCLTRILGPIMQNGDLCVMCHAPGEKRCGRCGAVRYCSQECQKIHWREHRQYCAAISGMSTVVPEDQAVMVLDARTREWLLDMLKFD
jgi:hypothetical protein